MEGESPRNHETLGLNLDRKTQLRLAREFIGVSETVTLEASKLVDKIKTQGLSSAEANNELMDLESWLFNKLCDIMGFDDTVWRETVGGFPKQKKNQEPQ